MRDERRKEERSNQGQTNNKAKQHSTTKAVTFPKKNELPRVGLEPTTCMLILTCDFDISECINTIYIKPLCTYIVHVFNNIIYQLHN